MCAQKSPTLPLRRGGGGVEYVSSGIRVLSFTLNKMTSAIIQLLNPDVPRIPESESPLGLAKDPEKLPSATELRYITMPEFPLLTMEYAMGTNATWVW